MKGVAKCNGPSCGAAIIWATTSAGKKMCLDAEPTRDGDWVIEGDVHALDPRAAKLSNDAAATYTGDKYTSHWGTCPDRVFFSKKKRS